MPWKYACSAWSLMAVGVLSWGLMGCGASAVRPGTSADKPASKGAVAKPEESGSIELDASPLQGKDRAKAIAAIKLHDEKKYSEAVQLFEALLERHSRHIAILHELAHTYRVMGQHEKAIHDGSGAFVAVELSELRKNQCERGGTSECLDGRRIVMVAQAGTPRSEELAFAKFMVKHPVFNAEPRKKKSA